MSAPRVIKLYVTLPDSITKIAKTSKLVTKGSKVPTAKISKSSSKQVKVGTRIKKRVIKIYSKRSELNEWEKKFIKDIKNRIKEGSVLTEKQKEKLDLLYAKTK